MFPCKIAAIPVFAVKSWLSQIGLPQVHQNFNPLRFELPLELHPCSYVQDALNGFVCLLFMNHSASLTGKNFHSCLEMTAKLRKESAHLA